MKAPFSEYLNTLAPSLKQLVSKLGEDYDYVSVLSTDSKGFAIRISQQVKVISTSNLTTERGSVVRVYKDGLYSEYAFNHFDADSIEETYHKIKKELDAQLSVLKLTKTAVYNTEKLEDEPLTLFVEKECEQLPENTDIEKLVNDLNSYSLEAISKDEHVVDCMVIAQSTHVSKLFLTANRDLRQSYVYCEGVVAPIIVMDGKNEIGYQGLSALGGPEVFTQLKDKIDYAVKFAKEVLTADPIEPGEYDIITTPEVSGLIAHEAFGHGVEMDMFVKNRALGKDFINKRVGSDLVTMHEGALCADNVTSFAFDDEGTLAGDVIEIENGILRSGICDALSALRLGVKPTGNGKRQNYEHKVYTRMTNTLFDSGTDKVEDMIASVKHGYLLEGMSSGMEDPKHWGIQCILKLGREIKDGKLTGKVVGPVIMTGYVTEVLGNVSMLSGDRGVYGCGACGKGHKEWVKVSDGGPYLKTKGRLG